MNFRTPIAAAIFAVVAAGAIATAAPAADTAPAKPAGPGPAELTTYLTDHFRYVSGGKLEVTPTWKKAPAGFTLYKAHLSAAKEHHTVNDVVLVFPSGKRLIVGETFALPAPPPDGTEARLQAWSAALKGWFGRDYTVKIAPGEPVEGMTKVSIGEDGPGGPLAVPGWLTADGTTLAAGALLELDTNPAVARLASVDLSKSPFKGPANAPLTVVEYSDFQCPACRERGREVVKHLFEKYPGKVKLYFRDFPLYNQHDWAYAAALAARCAYAQKPEAFWHLHDAIYEAQPDLTKEKLDSFIAGVAKEAQLDAAALTRCRAAADATLSGSMQEGRVIGVGSTPSFLIGGLFVDADLDLANVDRAVERALALAGAK